MEGAAISGGPMDANPDSLPSDVQFLRRTEEFTADTIPNALRKDHTTKAGTWALIQVSEGALRYEITDHRRPARSGILKPGDPPGIVEPTILHHVEPIGPVRFHVEFLRQPGG